MTKKTKTTKKKVTKKVAVKKRENKKDWSHFAPETREEVETKLTPYQKFTAFCVAFILLALITYTLNK